MKIWIARDYEGILTIHSHEPVYCEFEDRWTSPIATLDSSLFPEVTFENSPQEVELVIKRNNS